jgi:hypothetical protein
MTTVYLEGIGIEAPGLRTWDQARLILRGEVPFHFDENSSLVTTLIPENERRRASDTIRLAVLVANDAVNNAKIKAESLINVFASHRGDLKIVDHICNTLTLPNHPVSPTQFHNSVYNAPAAYWSVATQTTWPSTSLACAEYSFPAALLSSAACVFAHQQGVLLVTYDMKSPKPFNKCCAMEFNCGVGMVLMPFQSENTLAKLEVNFDKKNDTGLIDSYPHPVNDLINGNASAQPLRILSAVANHHPIRIPYDYLEKSVVDVDVQPCN